MTQLRQLFIWGPSIERLPDFTALTALEGLQVTASKVTTSPSFRALGELSSTLAVSRLAGGSGGISANGSVPMGERAASASSAPAPSSSS